VLLVEFFNRLDRVHDLVFHGEGFVVEALVADREDFLFHFVEEIIDFVLLFVGTARAFRAGADDLAQDVFVPHDLEVITDVGRCRHEGEKVRDEGGAANCLE
jgi:hypothetical protein